MQQLECPSHAARSLLSADLQARKRLRRATPAIMDASMLRRPIQMLLRISLSYASNVYAIGDVDEMFIWVEENWARVGKRLCGLAPKTGQQISSMMMKAACRSIAGTHRPCLSVLSTAK